MINTLQNQSFADVNIHDGDIKGKPKFHSEFSAKWLNYNWLKWKPLRTGQVFCFLAESQRQQTLRPVYSSGRPGWASCGSRPGLLVGSTTVALQTCRTIYTPLSCWPSERDYNQNGWFFCSPVFLFYLQSKCISRVGSIVSTWFTQMPCHCMGKN